MGELCYGRPSLIRVFLSWKTGYPDCCITAMETCCKKDSCHRRWACLRNAVITTLLQECIFRIDGLDIWQVIGIRGSMLPLTLEFGVNFSQLSG